MSERRDSWLARWTGADQLQTELERVTEEAAALRAELVAQHALTEQQAREIAECLREHDQLEQEFEQLETQCRLAEQATRSGARQAQVAQQRIGALQRAVSQRDEELTQLRATHDKVLAKNDKLEERLSRNEHELRTVQENLRADRAALSRAVEERSTLRTRVEHRDQELAELQRQLDDARAATVQQTTELNARVAAMSATHQRALREERQRWLMLVTRCWRALVRALGPAACVPLARELEAESVLGALTRAASPEAASEQLGLALSDLSLCKQVSIARQGRELELRLQAPSADGNEAHGWVGVFAVQCLGSMLGRSLQTCGLQAQDGALLVRARFRDRDDGDAAQA